MTRSLSLLGLCLLAGLWLASSPAGAATCDAFCVCGNDKEIACSQDCDSGWSALCSDGNCGGFDAGCCCQQYVIGGGVNYICVSKKCGIRFTRPSFMVEEAPAAIKRAGAQHAPVEDPAQEEWAYLEYQVGPDRKAMTAKARHASSEAFAEAVVQEVLAGKRSTVPGPGIYRTFELRAPRNRPGFGEARRVSQALGVLREPLIAAGIEEGQFALRLDLGAEGEILSRQEIFSTKPGISESLGSAVEKFLDQSGLNQAEMPLVIFIIFHLEGGNVVSVSTSNYIAG